MSYLTCSKEGDDPYEIEFSNSIRNRPENNAKGKRSAKSDGDCELATLVCISGAIAAVAIL